MFYVAARRHPIFSCFFIISTRGVISKLCWAVPDYNIYDKNVYCISILLNDKKKNSMLSYKFTLKENTRSR